MAGKLVIRLASPCQKNRCLVMGDPQVTRVFQYYSLVIHDMDDLGGTTNLGHLCIAPKKGPNINDGSHLGVGGGSLTKPATSTV